jgi:hypothetical protein
MTLFSPFFYISWAANNNTLYFAFIGMMSLFFSRGKLKEWDTIFLF